VSPEIPKSDVPHPDEPGRILVVDASYDTLDLLASSLREYGHHVALATDGRSGLQRAVETRAEVVLVDRDVQVLDVRTFVDVLTDNPRTADAHVFVFGDGDPADLASLGGRCEPIVKPFHAQEVAARVDEVIRLRRAPPRAPELEGELHQVALFDLLQVFAANRRTGLLEVESQGIPPAKIWLSEGNVVDATMGVVTGEKALHRVLDLRKGQFVFHPDRVTKRRRIGTPIDHLLMEAARRSDERAVVLEKLPTLATQVHLALRPTSVEGVSGELLAHVVDALDEARSLRELLDVIPQHDLEVLRALERMLSEGALAVYDAVHRIRFCDQEEMPAMRAAALRLRRSGVEGPVRLGVVGTSESVTRFARALGGLEEFVPAGEPPAASGDGAFGPLGFVRLGGTDLELFALPSEETLRPWWGTYLAASRAVVLLEPELEKELTDLARALDLRLVPAAAGVERPAGAIDTLREALGPVIRSSLRPVS